MEYINLMTSILTKAMSPVIIDYVYKMYNNPMDFIDSEKPGTLPQPSLINFQHALKKVQNLSGAQVQNFIGEIEKKCPSFTKYKDSVYIAYVKLVSNAVKMKSESKKIDIKPPTNELFVHQCLILCAHNFYENPYIMKEENETKRDKEIQDRVKFCISEAISESIPFSDIISEYMNDSWATDETAVENMMNPSGEPPPEESTKEDVNTESPITESPFENKAPDVELFPDAPDKHPEEEPTKSVPMK
jgi:hypothetical protein